MLNGWIKKYLELGEIGLQNSKKPGNPLAKYSRKKQLTDLEKLEYENMKLRIESVPPLGLPILLILSTPSPLLYQKMKVNTLFLCLLLFYYFTFLIS